MHRLIPAALFALSAAPALGEVAALSDTGFVIKHSAQASAGKSETWKVLTAPSRWWSGDHTYSGDAANLWLDAQATGCFCEKLPRPAAPQPPVCLPVGEAPSGAQAAAMSAPRADSSARRRARWQRASSAQ